MHDKLVIAPYVPGSIDLAKPLMGFKQAVLPLASRKTLLSFRGSCLPYAYVHANQTKISTGKVGQAAAHSLQMASRVQTTAQVGIEIGKAC